MPGRVEFATTSISRNKAPRRCGGFRCCRLGPPIFDENDHIKSEIRFPVLAAYVWFSETHTPLTKAGKSALLGIHNDTAYYLLYNGILATSGRLVGMC